MLGKAIVEQKYLMMPDPQTVVLYRLGSDDTVSDTQQVEFVERRKTSRRENQSVNGPIVTIVTTFHLWSIPLGGWKLRQRDRLRHLKADGSDEWFIIDSVDAELQDCRMRAECSPSGGLTL